MQSLNVGDIHLVGVGAGGTAKLRDLIRSFRVNPNKITLWDKDIFEPKNLDNQVFDEKYLGVNKAEALAEMYGCKARPEYFHQDSCKFNPDDLMMCGVDNHAGRLSCIRAADQNDCQVIISANSDDCAEAYIYYSEWKDTPCDPRVFYPELLTDKTNDPLGPPGCVEMIASGNTQSAMANMMGVTMAMFLFDFHTKTRVWAGRDQMASWPVHLKANKWGPVTLTCGQKMGGDR